MPIFGKSSRRKADPRAAHLPAKNAVYFYLIITAALVLPVAITFSVIYLPVAVNVVAIILLLVIAAIVVAAGRRIAGQTRNLEESLKLLENDQETRVSVLGGLIRVRIGQIANREHHLKLLQDESEDTPNTLQQK
jgi:hypothetical protein